MSDAQNLHEMIHEDEIRRLQNEIEYWKNISTKRILSLVNVLKVDEDDIIVVEVPVGDMPPHEISSYITYLAESFKEARLDGGFKPVEIFWFPQNSNGVGPKVELLKPEENDILVLKIPVGDLNRKEARQYLQDLSETFHLEDIVKTVLWLPVKNDMNIALDIVSKEEIIEQLNEAN